jgi:hypothetical protein
LKKPLDAAVIRNITRLRKRAPPERHNFRGRGSYLRIAAASRHDIGPSVSQSSSERKSDAAGSADHHGRFVCQIKKRMTHEALLRFASS